MVIVIGVLFAYTVLGWVKDKKEHGEFRVLTARMGFLLLVMSLATFATQSPNLPHVQIIPLHWSVYIIPPIYILGYIHLTYLGTKS